MQKILNYLFIFTFVSLLGSTPVWAQKEQKEKTEKEPKETMVIISTEYGDMKIKLYDQTPYHRDNFLKLARQGFYDGTLFHRVIKDFMIQGGDPDSKNAQPGQMLGNGGPGYTLPAEFVPELIHKRGALAAARLGDQQNPERQSSGSQFYLVQGKLWTDQEMDMIEQQRGIKLTPEQREIYKKQGGVPFLDTQYTVFGEVVEGLEVIDKIAATQTAPGDRPLKDVKMTVKVVE